MFRRSTTQTVVDAEMSAAVVLELIQVTLNGTFSTPRHPLSPVYLSGCIRGALDAQLMRRRVPAHLIEQVKSAALKRIFSFWPELEPMGPVWDANREFSTGLIAGSLALQRYLSAAAPAMPPDIRDVL